MFWAGFRGENGVLFFSRVLVVWMNNREDAVNEIRILASVRHPNIIRFRESFIENDTLFIVCPVHEQHGVCVCVCSHKCF